MRGGSCWHKPTTSPNLLPKSFLVCLLGWNKYYGFFKGKNEYFCSLIIVFLIIICLEQWIAWILLYQLTFNACQINHICRGCLMGCQFIHISHNYICTYVAYALCRDDLSRDDLSMPGKYCRGGMRLCLWLEAFFCPFFPCQVLSSTHTCLHQYVLHPNEQLEK